MRHVVFFNDFDGSYEVAFARNTFANFTKRALADQLAKLVIVSESAFILDDEVLASQLNEPDTTSIACFAWLLL